MPAQVQNHKILKIPHQNPALCDKLSQELGVSNILAQLLINRGLTEAGSAELFLKSGLGSMLDPFSFADMRAAVSLIEKASRDKKKVLLFGDYDVDGITSLALLDSTLKKLGLSSEHYIPHRIREGYGLSRDIAKIAREKKIGLLITADCGTNSVKEVAELRQNNVEVIVTDHHEQSGESAPASALINPKAKGASYKYRDLAGVGVAYKLCQALERKMLSEELDLVSLGTIADIVPLTGENRAIVKEGLLRLNDTKRLGLRALIESSGIKGKPISATFVSFILAPRINASGRMGSADTALSLLISEKEDEARTLASEIEGYNRQRQKIESRILEEAQAIIDREVNFKEHKVIVIAKEDWHQGVLGVVASKLADRFYRPTILISIDDKLCKGSGRSIKNFHLFQALLDCQDSLSSFGGHSHAVGMTIKKDDIEDFKRKINQLACERLKLEDLMPSLEVDMEVTLGDLARGLVREMEVLEPFGSGNPQPLFYTRGLKLKGEPQVLSRYTLKFWVTDGEYTYEAIGFGMAGLKKGLEGSGSFDLVFTPQIDDWRGKEGIILEIEDIFLK